MTGTKNKLLNQSSYLRTTVSSWLCTLLHWYIWYLFAWYFVQWYPKQFNWKWVDFKFCVFTFFSCIVPKMRSSPAHANVSYVFPKLNGPSAMPAGSTPMSKSKTHTMDSEDARTLVLKFLANSPFMLKMGSLMTPSGSNQKPEVRNWTPSQHFV